MERLEINLALIGIGPGGQNFLTQEAISKIQESDLILIPKKGGEKAELASVRTKLCETFYEKQIVEFDLPTRNSSDHYISDVNKWHDDIAEVWVNTLIEHAANGSKVSFLIWGDPSLYDSSIRIVNRINSERISIQYEIVAGITSLQALTAAHKIVLNELAEPVLITTGRNLREQGWPENVNVVAIMLDGANSFSSLMDDRVHIWWGAYVGMQNEYLIDGPLKEVKEEIITTRTKLRKQNGWIMDIYLMKRVGAKA